MPSFKQSVWMENKQSSSNLPYEMKAQQHSWNQNDWSNDRSSSSLLGNQRRKQSKQSNSWGVPNSWGVQDSWEDLDSQGVEHDERMKREEASRLSFSQNTPILLGILEVLLRT